MLADDIEFAKSRCGERLRMQPRNVLAPQVVHAFDYLSGDLPQLQHRVAAVLPAWSPRLPGYGVVLAMRAFGPEEHQPAGRARPAHPRQRLVRSARPDRCIGAALAHLAERR